MNGKEVLEKAIQISNTGDRQLNYGSPEDSFKRIADLWNHYLSNKSTGREVNQQDVAIMMILFKVARLENSPSHEDSLIDIAGYVSCLANINEKLSISCQNRKGSVIDETA